MDRAGIGSIRSMQVYEALPYLSLPFPLLTIVIATPTGHSRTHHRHSRESGNPQAPAMKTPCVYILASKPNGTLYIGVTSNLVQRVWQHKNDLVEGFSKRYGVHRLVWYEVHESVETAIAREKALKKWRRGWKVELIEEGNPN